MTGTSTADFGGVFQGKRVLVTGHTGFKGGWLCLWLRQLGARVTGLALPPETTPSIFDCCALDGVIDSRFANINDSAALATALNGVDADIVIHMAAQAIVRASYDTPAETFLTNVVGTAHVLDQARAMPSLKGAIVVTSDKCYENNEWVWGYRENDPMGGSDPYSASKGAAELLTASYRRSFFCAPEGPQLASARAGNVFGGGDWAADRLIPDIIRATLAEKPTVIRNPASVRPWQHVMEPLSGYLTLAARMLTGDRVDEGWNFGPDNDAVVEVETLAAQISAAWGNGGPRFEFGRRSDALHEAKILKLDSTKAATYLGWRPRLTLDQAIQMTVEWYRKQAEGADMRALTEGQISRYCELAAKG
ncbi:CDP-glucose 4,6-dehydratase [Actibacterium lipolyticum]|uniref:CDP-glucose 4,6-dehydratase n=1 Tax=Actibacterium lipolyticum TaxID=1524263 RepID=A0A238KYI4_9RHOB|nr:CDP-glucose 4,6-dehydratase [Actibacterium lipolyticum]SMX47262.1 CDP-glucose 4,6-dehydratase [Actibacterium lipolyticum]